MERVPAADLVERLPSGATDYVSEAKPVASFTSRASVPKGYVWPDFELDEELAPICLIRSSGAMGKSCAAQAIAATLRAPLVDVGSTPVGADSLTGLLAKALDYSGAAELTLDVRAGRRSVVIDGLDEAQLLVGKESYIAFVEDLLNIVDPSGPPGQIIAFGRHDAIETAHLAVLSEGQDASILPLLPLTLGQAHELIDNTLDLDPDFEIHRQHRAPFLEHRDVQFRDIGEALLGDADFDPHVDWDSVDDFLGYAPVVLAIAENLKVDNPAAALSAVSSRSASDVRLDRGALLMRIVTEILDREQEKVATKVSLSLGLEESLCQQVVFHQEEQIARLIALTTGSALEAAPPQHLPEDKKQAYEEAITPWVEDHPFIRQRKFTNVVFRDYLRAYVATSDLVEIFGIRREELVGACGAVGPFFGLFAHALTSPSARAGYGVVSEMLVSDLIESNALGVQEVPFAQYTHYNGRAHLLLGEEFADSPALSFHISDPDGVLFLRSPISHISVDTDEMIAIDSTDGRIDIGPGVVINANDIEFLGGRLTAYPAKQDYALGSLILARSVSHQPDLAVRALDEIALMVWWPDLTYQWRPFVVPIPKTRFLAPYDAQRLYQSLRRLLTGFRAGDDPWMYYERYENYVIGSGALNNAVADAMLEIGVLQRADESYTLDTVRLGEFSVHYAALQSEDWQDCLEQLAVEVSKNEQVAEVLGI